LPNGNQIKDEKRLLWIGKKEMFMGCRLDNLRKETTWKTWDWMDKIG
jgi:hypothetical protein